MSKAEPELYRLTCTSETKSHCARKLVECHGNCCTRVLDPVYLVHNNACPCQIVQKGDILPSGLEGRQNYQTCLK